MSKPGVKAPFRGFWLVLGLALIAAAVLAAGAFVNGGKTALRSLTVYVDGKVYLTAPLRPGETVVVTQENGAENVIRMTENGFYMESANCKNQDCVRQGEVTVDNWRGRKLLEQVICLPNHVTAALDLVDGTAAAADPDLPDI